LLATPLLSNAQFAKVQQAYEQVVAGKIDSAKMNIDEAAIHPDTKNDYNMHVVRGYVYKEIYKQRESNDINSPARKISIESFLKALTYPESESNKSEILQNAKFIASKFYNDAVRLYKDTGMINFALDNFEEFKNVSRRVDPAFDAKSFDVKFYLSLSTTYLEAYEATQNKLYNDLEKVYLLKVLDVEPGNFQANKNLGVHYYNLGVEVIKKMDYDVPLEELSNYQDASIKYARQAEPFMLKAHNINIEDRTVIEGLQGIYHLLNDTEKQSVYKKKLEALNNK
jgi:hypothetical protein